jgi:hypothetical protein
MSSRVSGMFDLPVASGLASNVCTMLIAALVNAFADAAM